MIEGLVDVIEPSVVSGWACDRSAPAEALRVEIWLDGDAVAADTANQFREDLDAAGTGPHAFRIAPGRTFSSAESRRLSVWAIAADGTSVPLWMARPPAPPENVAWQPAGYVEVIEPARIAGWALNRASPQAPLTATVVLDRVELGKADVSLVRPDLPETRLGHGHHGFEVGIGNDLPAGALSALKVSVADAYGNSSVLPRLNYLTDTVFAGASSDPNQQPLFILGSVRSGTSVIASALRQATRYKGFDEAHIFPLLHRLLSAVGDFYNSYSVAATMGAGLFTLPPSYFSDGIRNLFLPIMRDKFQTPYWIDKTPNNEMIVTAPLLSALYPKARFLFLKRRGIENVASRQRKFPQADFKRHCSDWADAMRFWIYAKESLAGKALEIDQLVIARNPDRVKAALGAFLELDEHEIAAIGRELLNEGVERTAESASRIWDIGEIGWSDAERSTFTKTCGDMMRQYGYSYDASYFESEADGITSV